MVRMYTLVNGSVRPWLEIQDLSLWPVHTCTCRLGHTQHRVPIYTMYMHVHVYSKLHVSSGHAYAC